jgi:hypothetical protein
MNDKTHGPDVRQEEDVIPWGKVLLGFSVALALASAMGIAAWANLKSREAALRSSGIFPEEHLGPRRSVEEVQQDLFGEDGFGLALNRRKQRELSSFGWVDREKRLVRIPIDKAMDRVVEENRR